MKKRKSILLVVLLLAVGFAAVSTTLYINGQTNINPNQDDFNVYYSDAYVNGTQDKSVITDDTHIVFETELLTLGEKYVLDYEVTNGSKNYDAELVMECTGDNDYLTVTNEFDDERILEARNTRNGTLTLELKKSNAGEDVDVIITCTISANAVERTSLGIIENNDYIFEGNFVNSDGTALANANFVIFSETPHYVTTDSAGYMFYNGLEQGEHEIYYVDDTLENIKDMTKDEIISNSASSATFNTNKSETIIFNDYNKIVNLNIEKTEIYCENLIGTTWEYDYVNNEQKMLTRCDGVYNIEAWGAQGGSVKTWTGGYGGYSVGSIALKSNELLFINVGGSGTGGMCSSSWTTHKGGYNGGATVKWYETNVGIASGGGATHIAFNAGLLKDFENNIFDVIIVAGAGGGAYYHTNGPNGHGGHAGGYKANSGTTTDSSKTQVAQGGTQESGGLGGYWNSVRGLPGEFGQADQTTSAGYGAGGGSGYYGGGGSSWGGAGGGSSYIGNPNLTNKAMYCYECEPSEDEDTKTISVKNASDTAIANTPKKGHGYAKITYLGTN